MHINLSYGPFISRKQALAAGIKDYYTGKQCKYGHFAVRNCTTRVCKQCIKETHRPKDYARHRQSYINRATTWNKNNPEKASLIFTKNTKRRMSTGQHQELVAKRRCHLKEQTPDLTASEKAEIAQLYKKARALSKTTGISHEVDHIRPVSKGGAHHPTNLQILTEKDNRLKSNKW